MGRSLSALIAIFVCCALVPSLAAASQLTWTLKLEPSQVRLEAGEGGIGVSVDGMIRTEYIDYPSLPYRVVGILLPQGEEVVSYRAEALGGVPLERAAALAPYRGAEFDDGTTRGIATKNADVVDENGVFPKWRVRYVGSSSYRGYRVASFAIYPVRCDLATGAVSVSPEVRLIVETGPAAPDARIAERMRSVPGFREESRGEIESMVVNPEAASTYVFDEIIVDPGTRAFMPSYQPSMEGSEVRYVIVTNEAMKATFQKLADYKTKKGIPAVVRTIEWIAQNYRSGADLAESIRIFIIEAYAKWGVEYVVLGGDTDVIPARFGYVTFYTGELIPTDMYYACLDGTWNADSDSLWGEAYHSVSDPGDNADLYAEVYLGRMPVSTASEALILVNKTIAYSAPADVASKQKFLILAEVVFPSDYTPGATIILDGAEIGESVYQTYIQGNPNITATRLFENYPAYPGSLQLTRARALDSLGAGTNHVLHIGHGFKYNMSVGDGSILNYDANGLMNGSKLFTMYLMNCTNVAFDTDCLAEYFLLNANGGAFSVTGASRSAFPSASRPYLDYYYSLLFDENVVQLGKLFTKSREPYTSSAYGETADRWTHFIYNFLGDPEACLFQEAVRQVAIAKPGSAVFGPNDITITVTVGGVPIDSAYVCLYKDGDDYRYESTGPGGAVTFEDFLVKSSGKIYVTVTGMNCNRAVDSIQVTQLTPPYLRMSSKRFDDTVVGNSDNVVDAGETGYFQVKLRNTGQTAASKLYAKIRSTDANVTVLDSVAIYPDIPAGTEAWNSDPFRFSVDELTADEYAAEFTLDVHDSTGGSWSETFALEVHSPQLELYVNVVSDTLPYGDNDGVIEEGEHYLVKIGIKNFGTGVAYGFDGAITSLDPNLVVYDGASAYDPIGILGVKYGDGFVISETNVGLPHLLSFVMTDDYGRTFSEQIELRKPNPPTGIALNSSHGPTEIHATWRAPDTAEKYSYQIFHSQSQTGPFTLANKDKVIHNLFRDTELNPSTRYYYKFVSVDSCGNESVPSAVYTATTSPPQLAGWPNKVGKESASSPRIGDVDGDTHPDVVVGSDYVYAWSGNGIEIRDGDGQPLTWGVFNTLGSNYTASCALANLDGVLGNEIIGASWNTKQIYVFDKNGAALPGWPQTTQVLCWASPTVGDIDGDGDLEIMAYDVYGWVYAWHANGTEVRDGDSNPATNGRFFLTKNNSTWHVSTPGLADIDEDGIVELIVCSPNDSIYCLNGDASRVAGWPVQVVEGGNIGASPAIGDVDGDGHLEVIVQASNGRVYGLNHNGTWMTGWPQWVYSNTTFPASPALADFDDDGKLEIVIAGMNQNIYVYRYNGTLLTGWPKQYASSGIAETSPCIADITGDGSLDIILGSESGRLNAWSIDGQPIAGFPIELGTFIRGTPMVSDLDFDGSLDLVVSAWDQYVRVWDLSAATYYRGCAAWNGFRSNYYNSGWKEFKQATGFTQITASYRLAGGAIELQWNVVSGEPSWTLYRAEGEGAFEFLAAGLRADNADVVSYVDPAVEEGITYRYRLVADDSPELSVETEGIMVPVASVRLYQNHPNPFNPSTRLAFTVPGGTEARVAVVLAVYDVNGALVKTLVNGALAGGRYEMEWDGRNSRGEGVASGIYFARLAAAGNAETKKMVLLR